MLSARGAEWAGNKYAHGEQDQFSETNPDGTVNFGNAENWLMHGVLADYLNKNSNKIDETLLAYGEGYTGTSRLRAAMATHLNAHFKPATEIDAEEITFAAGVTSLNEICALLTCNEGEAVMLGRPNYGTFNADMTTRTGVKTEFVSVGDLDQFGISCVAGYDAGFEAARKRGVEIKALIICNPHNPLGRCYSRESLVELLRFCGPKGIHLISDEIYALSTYLPSSGAQETFTSVRSIDLSGLIDPNLVHVLYGISKDFGAAGLRLGCLISQNEQFTAAARACCRFCSPSRLSMAAATRVLEDQEFVCNFLHQSQNALRSARLLAEKLLEENEIPYSKIGNAGLFIWLDLSSRLPLEAAQGDTWEAARILDRRLRQEKVICSNGEAYRSERPGQFRLIFCMKEPVLREGIRRIARAVCESRSQPYPPPPTSH